MKMDESEHKLIHFDSSCFLPGFLPLIHIDPSDEDASYSRVKFEQLRRVFREETNRDDLMLAINPPLFADRRCACGAILPPTVKSLLNHLFSQAHMDKYLRERGSVSSVDYTFWLKLFHAFPKGRSRLSKNHQLIELVPLLEVPSLYDRPSLLTVEVSSEEEREKALCNFISHRLLRSEEVAVFVRDSREANTVTALVKKHIPGATSTISPKDMPCSVVFTGPLGGGPHSVVFLRPPKNLPAKNGLLQVGGDEKCGDCYVPGFVAYMLTSDLVPSALLLVKGREEMASFRAFEKRFSIREDILSEQLPPLPILTLEQMIGKNEAETRQILSALVAARTAKKEEKKKASTVAKPEKKKHTVAPGEQQGTSAPEGSVIPMESSSLLSDDEVKTIQKSSATEPSKRQQRALQSRRKREKEKRGAAKVQQTTCPDNVDVDDDDWNLKERPPIFVPFDEETGKAVGEWIETLSMYSFEDDNVDNLPFIFLQW